MARVARPGWLQAAVSARRSRCRGDACRVAPFDWGTELPDRHLRLESAGRGRIRLQRPQRRAGNRWRRRYAADYTAASGDVNAYAHGRGALESVPRRATAAGAFSCGLAAQTARMARGRGLRRAYLGLPLAVSTWLARVPGNAEGLPGNLEKL